MEDVIEDAIEKAYWEFDAMHRGLNEWGQTPLSERDAFKRVCRNLAAGAFPVTREIIDYMAENAQLKAELAQAKAREARLLEALKSIGQIRFLLGNDPRLNPAYEMGAIAQQALEEAGT